MERVGHHFTRVGTLLESASDESSTDGEAAFRGKTEAKFGQRWTRLDNGGHGQLEAVFLLQGRRQFVHRRQKSPQKMEQK
jgi:hypothetical protein